MAINEQFNKMFLIFVRGEYAAVGGGGNITWSGQGINVLAGNDVQGDPVYSTLVSGFTGDEIDSISEGRNRKKSFTADPWFLYLQTSSYADFQKELAIVRNKLGGDNIMASVLVPTDIEVTPSE